MGQIAMPHPLQLDMTIRNHLLKNLKLKNICISIALGKDIFMKNKIMFRSQYIHLCLQLSAICTTIDHENHRQP